MPCKSDVPEWYQEGLRLKELLAYVKEELPAGVVIETELPDHFVMHDIDVVTMNLCTALSSMQTLDPKLFDSIVYNAKNKTSRNLADWWERHVEHDTRRKLEAELETKRRQLRLSGIAKLTAEEIKALDIKL